MLNYQNRILEAVKERLPEMDIVFTRLPSAEMGDIAIPCFTMAKQLRKSPADIARDLEQSVAELDFVCKTEVKGGYLNIFLNKTQLFRDTITEIFEQGYKYGSSMSGAGKTALIEHTSINPNASPHVGRARNAMIGDSLVRIMKFEGYKVDTHYFVNDIGKQIAMLLLGVEDAKAVTFGELLDIYVKVNSRLEKEPELEKKVFELLYKLENGDEDVKHKFRSVVDICIAGQISILGELGIKYDTFKYESDYIWSNRLEEILNKFKSTGKLEEAADGRLVLNLSEYNLSMKEPYFVLTRADKTSLYPTRDIAYTIDKADTCSHKNIIVLGEDQKLYFQELSAALDILGYKFPEVVHYSFVLLAEGKMATRKGNVVLLEDFMKEALTRVKENMSIRRQTVDEAVAKAVAYGAVKYAFLKVDNNKNITFDWETALSFDGDTGPYLQYSCARISSIIKKYGAALPEKADFSLLKEASEYALIKEAADFKTAVSRTLDELSPHIIANYVHGLAKAFSTFYHDCPVLNTDCKDLRDARVMLIAAVRQVIVNALQLLGIDAVDSM
ncbi:MAG: arginine--tRNA ligase [Bacillota bacterium]